MSNVDRVAQDDDPRTRFGTLGVSHLVGIGIDNSKWVMLQDEPPHRLWEATPSSTIEIYCGSPTDFSRISKREHRYVLMAASLTCRTLYQLLWGEVDVLWIGFYYPPFTCRQGRQHRQA